MTKNSRPFKFPISNNELLYGYVFLPVYIIILPKLVGLIAAYLNPDINGNSLIIIFYLTSFLIVVILFRKFLKSSFSDLTENKLGSFFSIISGYLCHNILMYLVSILMVLFNAGSNPNDEVIIEQIKLNPNTMIAVTVLLGPVVEETLFRGVVFGTIRRKNRTAAYLISFLIFAVYHLWEYILVAIGTAGAFNWSILLNLLQYLPGSLALAWCYERSGTIWAPIFLHMLINALNISAII